MRFKITYRLAYGSREKGVVGVQPGDDVSVRAFPALINRRGLAHVGLTFPLNPARVFAKNSGRRIGRAVVNNQVLDIWIILCEHTVQSISEKVCLIESWSDY